MKYLIVAVLASTITIFALQNHAPTTIRFVVWTLEGTSLAGVILVSVAAGIVLVGLPLWIDRWRLRARSRALESRLAVAEARVAESSRSGASPDGPPNL